MHLLALANELIFLIAETLDAYDLSSLLRSNHRLAKLLQPILQKYALRQEYSMEALYWAAAKGDESMVRRLLEKGAGIKVVGDDNTVLFQTPDEPSNETVVFVLEKAANLVLQGKDLDASEDDLGADGEDQGDIYGRARRWAALHWAVRSGKERLVKRLLERAVDISHRTHSDWVALHRAAWRGNVNIVRLLLDNGAAAQLHTTEGIRGRSPLHLAIRRENEDVVRILLERGASINQADFHQITPLFLAVSHNFEAISELLIQRHADVNAQNSRGNTALHLAIRLEYDGITRLLVENKAEVDLRNRAGEEPIHEAALSGSKDIVMLLLGNGADVNSKDGMGNMPLHLAASVGNDVSELLIKNGAIIDYANDQGNTALHLAVLDGNMDPVRLLIHHGADISWENNNGDTPLSSRRVLGICVSEEMAMLLSAGED